MVGARNYEDIFLIYPKTIFHLYNFNILMYKLVGKPYFDPNWVLKAAY